MMTNKFRLVVVVLVALLSAVPTRSGECDCEDYKVVQLGNASQPTDSDELAPPSSGLEILGDKIKQGLENFGSKNPRVKIEMSGGIGAYGWGLQDIGWGVIAPARCWWL